MPDVKQGTEVIYESEFGPMVVSYFKKAGKCPTQGQLHQIVFPSPEGYRDEKGNIRKKSIIVPYNKEGKSGCWHFKGDKTVKKVPVRTEEVRTAVSQLTNEELLAELKKRAAEAEANKTPEATPESIEKEPGVETEPWVKVERVNKKGKKVARWIKPDNARDGENFIGQKQVPVK